MELDYGDERGRLTQRIILPLALIYYSETVNIVAWCELRQARAISAPTACGRAGRSTPFSAAMARGFAGNGWPWARDRAAERERTD